MDVRIKLQSKMEYAINSKIALGKPKRSGISNEYLEMLAFLNNLAAFLTNGQFSFFLSCYSYCFLKISIGMLPFSQPAWKKFLFSCYMAIS